MADQRVYATGKRKTAVARVWISPGNGTITVNKKPLDEYIERETSKMLIYQPLMLTGTYGKIDVYATVKGGGKSGQAGALRHGIAKALAEYNPEFRDVLKSAGLLTRDARVKERKKYGLRGARRACQFSKR
ncbi:30S ribosomal protein S9 [Thermodesulforhabdus norvegica]|uniref:Small ribosomal subunit protein uS9 n=1 Tax=Thermodesulforhabdus norvegica TaxID=39841 RepID=A0A1I4QHB6_9BACT|nr:30S ribosomal protein S9 [Thermodesulforhabdus norvegica]SFM39040.1 SSU ribosomal protein S9P [Thermodesulforhabdus norvegica]